MENVEAVAALSALAHEGRLQIFRLLIIAGPSGLTVGELAKKLKMPGATLSFHLAQLKRAGLVAVRRNGRQLIQSADFKRMNGLIGYLTENCCGGTMSCFPATSAATCGEKPKEKRKAR